MEGDKKNYSKFVIISFISLVLAILIALAFFYMPDIITGYHVFFFGFFTLISFIHGIKGLMDIKKNNKKGMIFAIIGVLLSFIIIIVSLVMLFGMAALGIHN